MELTRPELKKIISSFNNIASRIMRASFEEYNKILSKFLHFIEEDELIFEYMNSIIDNEYNAECDWNRFLEDEDGYLFDFGPSDREEASQIYSLLKYVVTLDDFVYLVTSAYGERKYQDGIQIFNDRVVLVLINHIQGYLTRIGIDMGLSDNVTYNVQAQMVNIANDSSTINATQNNGVDTDKIEQMIKSITEKFCDISEDKREIISDAVEMVKEELGKPEPKKGRLKNCLTVLAPMVAICNGAPVLANNLQTFINYIQSIIG